MSGESKNPNLHWFEFPCGNYRVGTWATSQRAARKIVSNNYRIEASSNVYGKSRPCLVII